LGVKRCGRTMTTARGAWMEAAREGLVGVCMAVFFRPTAPK